MAGIIFIVQLLTPVVQIYAPLCNAQWKKKGGGGRERCKGRGGGCQTATGKINTNVVRSWVLMSTTHSQLRNKYKWAERKNKKEKDVKY